MPTARLCPPASHMPCARRRSATPFSVTFGYGADPGWVIDTVRSCVGRGAIAVQGNHDAAVVHGPRKTMNAEAQQVIAWTRAQLDESQLAFLAGLPLQVEDDGRLFVHANAWAPQRWEYILTAFDARSSMAATRCRYTFCGHIHEPTLYHMGADWRASAFTPVAGVAASRSAPNGAGLRFRGRSGSRATEFRPRATHCLILQPVLSLTFAYPTTSIPQRARFTRRGCRNASWYCSSREADRKWRPTP
jgi:hypothetical protein